MSHYHEQQLFQICPVPAEKLTFPVKVQFRSEHGKTNHFDLTPEAFKAIERILSEMPS